jgi:hypothetical protein
MNQELKNAIEVIKKHCSQPKGKTFTEYMDTASLKQRIASLKGYFLHYVDHITIWYYHNQQIKAGTSNFDTHPNYTKVELSKKQREDAIAELEWFKKDIEACISHLKK